MTSLADKILVGCYGAVPRTQAVTYLLDCLPPVSPPAKPLPAVGGPGATPAPPPRPSFMTRCKRHYRNVWHAWSGDLPFPNPLQSFVLALWISVCFLIGGADRLTAPVYSAVRTYGGDRLWGLGFITVTIVMFIAWRWLHHGLFVAYIAASSAYLMFAIAMGQAASNDRSVSWIAFGVFGWLFWVHAMAAARVSGEWRWVTRRHE